jgi:hypothetical protein
VPGERRAQGPPRQTRRDTNSGSLFFEGLMNRLLPLLGVLAVGGLLAGCGGGGPAKVKVTGELLNNGKPLQLSNQVMKTLIFHSQDAAPKGKSQTSYAAVVAENGSFEVAEIPAGKYLITLELLDGTGDICKGAFTKEQSGLIREITGAESITIDIAKPPAK